jgi:hypothetical protein
MDDPFALDLTIILLLLGVGAAMIVGNLAAIIKSRKDGTELFLSRTIFLMSIGLVISSWSIASLINR